MHSESPQHEPEGTAAPPAEKVGWWATIRASLSGEHHEYTDGSISRAVFLLAIPMVLELVMESLFAITDIYWVAKLGPEATAAVGLTESVLTLYYAIGIGLAMAATATVARRIGEKDREGAAKAGAQAIHVGLAVGLPTGLLCYFLAGDILRWMGGSEALIAEGTRYTQIILGGNVVVLLLFLNNAIFRGAGDAAIAMRSLWIANGINIVLDPFLIFGWWIFPEMGLTGAAVATLTGRTIGVLYQFHALRTESSRITIRGTAWQLDLARMFRLLRVSLGGIGQMAIATSSWVLLMKIMAKFGDAALAGYTIAIRIIIFTILPSWGLSNAAATLTGQNLGAGKPERAVKSVWITGWFNMVFLILVMVLFLVLSPSIVAIFTDDEKVAAYAVDCMRIISLAYPFFAWGMVLAQAFNGAGDTMTPTWINFIAFWCFQLPLAWLLALYLMIGPSGVFWAVTCADILLVIIALPVFLHGKWKQKAV